MVTIDHSDLHLARSFFSTGLLVLSGVVLIDPKYPLEINGAFNAPASHPSSTPDTTDSAISPQGPTFTFLAIER
jgi:hypothetical protein